MATSPAQHYIPQCILKNFSEKDKKKNIFWLNCKTGHIDEYIDKEGYIQNAHPIKETACGLSGDSHEQRWGENYEKFAGRHLEDRLCKLVQKCINEGKALECFENFKTYFPEFGKCDRSFLLTGLLWEFLNQDFFLKLENRYVGEKGEIIQHSDKSKNNGYTGHTEYSRAIFRHSLIDSVSKSGFAGSFHITEAPKGESFIIPDCFAIPFIHIGRGQEFENYGKEVREKFSKAQNEEEKEKISQEYIKKQWGSYGMIVFPLSSQRALFLFHEDMKHSKMNNIHIIKHFYDNNSIYNINAQAIACAYHNAPFYVYGADASKLLEYYRFFAKTARAPFSLIR